MPQATRATDLPGKPRRFYELDSLRGLAALSVVFYHFCIAYGQTRLSALLHRFPLRILIDGHQAVVLFFLLSGFVLSLPYRHSRVVYKSFLVRRICRIYLPYVGALLLAVACDLHLHGTVRAGSAWSDRWVDLTWSTPVRGHLVLQSLLFLGNYDWSQYNTAFWSLIYEMRISLVFPFVAVAVLRHRSRWVLPAALLCSLATRPLAVLFAPLLQVDLSKPSFLGSQTFFTLDYLAFFILGALLAKELDRITRWYARLPAAAGAALGVLAVMLYDVESLTRRRALFITRLTFPEQVVDWITASGALLFILFSLQSPHFKAFLHHRLVHHLGRVSYSLYLVHSTVLFSLIHLYPAMDRMWVVALLYLPITALLTEVFYRLVEEPSMRLGRLLSKERRPRGLHAVAAP